MDDDTTARIVRDISREHIPFFRDIARALRDEGKFADSLALCDLILQHAPDDWATNLVSIRSLEAAGRLEDALGRLAAIKSQRINGEFVSEMQRQLGIATDLFGKCMVGGDATRAIALADHMLALCPHVDLFEQARAQATILAARQAARLEHEAAAELVALHQQALRDQEALDFDAEIPRRLAIFRHPHAAAEHSAVRLSNVANLIARLLGGDISDAGHPNLTLVRELLAFVVRLPIDPDRIGPVAPWERFQRRILGSLDLDVVFGPAVASTPPWPLAFTTLDGTPLTLDDVVLRGASLGAEAVFFTSASPEYFDRYVRTHVAAILNNCDCGCLILVCVCVPRDQLAGIIAGCGLDDPRVIFCADDFDPDAVRFDIVNGTDREPFGTPAAYYASSALLHMDLILQHLKLPVFVCGIDTVLQNGVRALLDRTRDADVVLNAVGPFGLLGSHYVNSLVLTYPTDNGLLFVQFLKTYLGGHLAQRVQAAAIDQVDLHMAKHHLLTNGHHPVIESFGPDDVNNAMFNQSNHAQHNGFMRRFTFLNMFVGGSGDEALTIQDVSTEPLARAA